MQDNRIRGACSMSAASQPLPCGSRRRRQGQPVSAADGATAWTYLTVAQAAHRLGVSEKTIRRRLTLLAAQGAAIRVGAAWRIDPNGLHLISDLPVDDGRTGSPPRVRVRVPSTSTRSTAKKSSGLEWPS
jgi:hypothetical protein